MDIIIIIIFMNVYVIKNYNANFFLMELFYIGGRHWTTMVLTLDPTSGNPVAFFADSFGVRRNAIFASVDLSNNQLLSYE